VGPCERCLALPRPRPAEFAELRRKSILTVDSFFAIFTARTLLEAWAPRGRVRAFQASQRRKAPAQTRTPASALQIHC
jgi:hypothetical protein